MIKQILFLIFSFYFVIASIHLCPSDQFFDNQHCQLCQPNCVCTSYNTCTYCITGYTFNVAQTSCIQCPVSSGLYGNCTQCCSNDSGTITSCTDCDTSVTQSVFLSSGRCIIQIGCFNIDNNGFCIQCSDGYFRKDNKCLLCDISCNTCLDIDNCLSCTSGYYYNPYQNGALCTACTTGCASCNVNGTCFSCLNQFYNLQNQCLPCPQYCLTCFDGSTCTSCLQGILLDNICVLCTDTIYSGSRGCSNCVASNSFVLCNQCQDTYYLDSNNNCILCSSVIPNSIRCQDENTPTQCKNDNNTVLNLRYYLVGVLCVLNTDNCKQISYNTKCSSCYPNYIMNSTFSCVLCTFTGCDLSSSSVIDNQCICTKCLFGYYLSSSICLACSVSNCAVCNTSSSTCNQCMPGFYNFSTIICSPVLVTLLNCNISSNSNSCTTCNIGYYLGSDNNCYKCQQNCLSCVQKYVCSICAPYYYLYMNANCIAYPNNCLVMNNYNCTVCSNGYYVYNGLCRPCSIQLGTLSLCSGLCPLDLYIQSIVIINYELLRKIYLLVLIIILQLMN